MKKTVYYEVRAYNPHLFSRYRTKFFARLEAKRMRKAGLVPTLSKFTVYGDGFMTEVEELFF